tara:strand:+ start:417 stop:620 length:204 start_codon:yes stop_codon:yes gene_type:complete
MLRIFMTDGTDEEMDQGTEKWSMVRFNVSGRDAEMKENIFISPRGMAVDGVGFMAWQDFYALITKQQ